MITFTVYGTPQPAGSKRAMQHPVTQRIVVLDAAKNSRPWKNDVAETALQSMTALEPLEGPLILSLVFYVQRPKGHYGKRGLRPSAPRFPAVRPDVTKLIRAVEDAMTGIVWRDDAQVVDQHALKRYGEPARCEITVGAAEAI